MECKRTPILTLLFLGSSVNASADHSWSRLVGATKMGALSIIQLVVTSDLGFFVNSKFNVCFPF